MESKTFPLAGWSLIIIGIIHNLFGIIVGWRILLDATNAGLIEI